MPASLEAPMPAAPPEPRVTPPPRCREGVPLAPYTWFRLGGPARFLFEPQSESELSEALRHLHARAIPVRFLGKGANLLIDDAGVDAAVIRLIGESFERVTLAGTTVTAGAGADLMKLVKQLSRSGLGGLEVLAGIPATVGGAVRMNCGGKYGEIGARVRSVRVVTPTGEICERSDVRFSYRATTLGEDRVVGATFELVSDDPRRTADAYERIWREKMASQPALGERSAGCIFKNPPEHKAGQLIDQCGLKGTRVGGAEVSHRHANFIVAHAGATARDVFDLITLVQGRVAAQRGVWLETEVEIWRPESAGGGT